MSSLLARLTGFGVLAFISFYAGRVTAPAREFAQASPAAKALKAPAEKANESPTVALDAKVPLSDSEIKAWKQRLDGVAASAARDEDRLRMVAAWAQVDPLSALAYARSSFSHDALSQAMTAVFTNWAKKDPQGAWNWVLANEPGAHSDLRSVLAETGRNNPGLAGQFAAEFATAHPEASAEVYFAALDGVFHTGNFETAKTLIAQAKMPNEEQKNSLINLLAGQWARYQPENAAAWVLQLPAGPVRDQALDAVGQAWSDIDPIKAADFAVNLPPGPDRQTALRQAISKWTLDDPAQASKWVLQFDAHEDFDQAVASIATSYNVMNRNTNLALNWAATIQNPALRTQSVTSIVSTWYVNDAPAALNYIKNSPDVSAESRKALLKVVASMGPPPVSTNP